MLDSMLKICQSKISEEDSSLLTPRMIQQKILPVSSLKSSFWTIPVKSLKDMHQYSIVTPLILLANSLKSNLRSIEELVKLWKKSQNSSNQEMLVWLEWSHKNQCVLSHSINIHHSEDSPSETWNKQLPSVSSKKLPRKTWKEVKMQPKVERRNEH